MTDYQLPMRERKSMLRATPTAHFYLGISVQIDLRQSLICPLKWRKQTITLLQK
jgi:hypothetical protein